jgi:hypothetical protein
MCDSRHAAGSSDEQGVRFCYPSVTFPLCTPIIITQFRNIVDSLILIKRYACARAPVNALVFRGDQARTVHMLKRSVDAMLRDIAVTNHSIFGTV